MSEPKLVFNQTIESLFQRALKDSMAPALKAELKASGLDLDKPLDPAYPAESVNRWFALAAKHTFPTLVRDEGLRALGSRFIDGWQQTLLGKATAALLVIVGPTRALRRMTQNFRTGDNFTQVEFEERAKGDVELRFNYVIGGVAFVRGMLEAGGELTRAKNFLVTVVRETNPGAVFSVRFDP